MKIILPKAEYIDRSFFSSPYSFIEYVGRTCYKSNDKITRSSAVPFVKGLIASRHLAMLEHHPVHCVLYNTTEFDFYTAIESHFGCVRPLNELTKYMAVTFMGNCVFISASLRVYAELMNDVRKRKCAENYIDPLVNEWFSAIANAYSEIFNTEWCIKDTPLVRVIDDYRGFTRHFRKKNNGFLSEDQIDKEISMHITHTIRFVCDRGVSHEFVRHRLCSFAQESTRYCNYSNSKFGEEITVILPGYLIGKKDRYEMWKNACECAEKYYFELLSSGCTPQEARAVLPNSLKTELIVTANETEWQHIINLRYLGTTGKPHPQIKGVMSIAIPSLVRKSEGRLKA